MDLSIIILSFNTKDITARCLGKVKISKDYCEKRLKNKIEVIVLDNASEDGSVGVIRDFREKNRWVKLIESKENTGFSKGNNIAMRQSKNPYILLLNSDVYLEEESLYKALAYFRVNLNCDVLGARLNYASGELQLSAGPLPDFFNIFLWIFGLRGFHPKAKKYFSKAHKVGWVMGAFVMLKRKVFEETKGFDENLFMHMEEIEWCKRINNKGFRVWYVPQVSVTHLHGASTNFDLGPSFFNELKGIKYYIKKHISPLYLPLKALLTAGLIFRVIAFSLLGKTKRAKVYMEGIKVI
ncbi:glycosyltransferase family 2 protein [Candidatus Daviesbacteria bacterium]|nr:glycosyltransferase family 2 protein [Candidatus Daviesbacteria bacterium]